MKQWVITKWCKPITDDGKDLYTHRHIEGDKIRFRLLDDDGNICAYGEMSMKWWNDGTEEKLFAPLERYMYDYGVTDIQYKIDGVYESI